MLPAASIIISSYHQASSIIQSIESLKRDNAINCMHLEILIADDGSLGPEIEKMAEYLSNTRGHHLDLKLVWQEDRGFRLAESRNNGIRLSKGQILIFLDGDCIPNKGFVRKHLDAHQQNPSTICVGKRHYRRPRHSQKSELSIESEQLYTNIERTEDSTIRYQTQSSMPWKSVLGRNFSIPRLDPMVYFDERMFGWGGEDLGYALALENAGLDRVVYEKDAIVTHYGELQPNNPHHLQNPLHFAYTLINHLLLLKLYSHQESVYVELSKYLFHYKQLFCFDGEKFVFIGNKQQGAKNAFDHCFLFTEARQLFDTSCNEISLYSQTEKRLYHHPGFLELIKKPLSV